MKIEIDLTLADQYNCFAYVIRNIYFGRRWLTSPNLKF